MDERLLERLNVLFARLRRRPALMDAQGRDVLTGELTGDTVPLGLRPGETTAAAGWAYLRSESAPDLVWAADATDAADSLLMADALLGELMQAYPEAAGADFLYRRLLLSDEDPRTLETAVAACGIPWKLRRCVLLMKVDETWRGDLLKSMRDILPAGPTDVIVSVDRSTVAYIVDMSAVDDPSDLMDYASAAQESALSESGCALLIGIGGCASDLMGLRTSFLQAQEALNVGRTFLPRQTLFEYQRLLMPRFLAELPKELAARYHYQLFSAETARLLTDELLETANMFFEKDLNLSDTARQLYIHRNTLTYRLDKIERITGLDLRKFDDAVTFKMLLEMKKRAQAQ